MVYDCLKLRHRFNGSTEVWVSYDTEKNKLAKRLDYAMFGGIYGECPCAKDGVEAFWGFVERQTLRLKLGGITQQVLLTAEVKFVGASGRTFTRQFDIIWDIEDGLIIYRKTGFLIFYVYHPEKRDSLLPSEFWLTLVDDNLASAVKGYFTKDFIEWLVPDLLDTRQLVHVLSVKIL